MMRWQPEHRQHRVVERDGPLEVIGADRYVADNTLIFRHVSSRLLKRGRSCLC